MQDLVIEKSKEMQEFAQANGLKEALLVTDDVVEKADCFFIDGTKSKGIRKDIQRTRHKFCLIAVLGSPERNREILEACPDVLLSPHFAAGKDFMKVRNAGLDSVTCKIAAKNKISIGIDFSEILKAQEQEREILIGRIMQNIRLCRKYKVKMLIATFASSVLEMRSAHDLQAFAQALGMTPKEAQDALHEAGRILMRNQEKKHPSYVSDGIRIVE